MTALEEFADDVGLDPGAAMAAELVLDELLNNIISYGSQSREEQKIEVELCVEEDTLKIVISDSGIPFDPFTQEAPDLSLSVEDRELGGVGIHLVKKFMDEYSYQRLGERNVVTLLKSLK